MALSGEHAEYLRQHNVARMMEMFLAALLRERPECATAFAAKFFREHAASSLPPVPSPAAEPPKPWAVHLVLTYHDASAAGLQQLAEFHAAQWGCLRRFVGAVEAVGERAGGQGFTLHARPWRNLVYAVYASAEKLRAVPADALDEAVAAVRGTEYSGEVEEHWLEYSVGAGRREICGELLFITGLETEDPERQKKIPFDWAQGLEHVAAAEGFGFARLYTRMQPPLPDCDRGSKKLAAVNLTSFDTIEAWEACAKTPEFALANARSSDIPRAPGIFRVRRYH
eukprot:TRINITY_DN65321_c0_g1_i1.p2 TRINITY_DN65321_c0_g1~~TRINITY_DN65321_c0_g1_i1.p2  ORF type:complete len:283 (+),score=66.38 TRINITY_DN65321_c0_g1_i1:86-934(+)